MKQTILTLAIALCCAICASAQAPQGGKRQPLTEEQITQMMTRHATMVKKQLNLTNDQEAQFDKEYNNYNTIVLATRTKQFKNQSTEASSAAEAVATINDAIDSQLAELVAKRQLINNLQNVLTAEQLNTLHRLTSSPMGMGPGMGGRGGKAPRGNADNQRPDRGNSHGSWGGGNDSWD